MPKSLDVENQRFEFGDRWMVAFKYDDSAFYRKGPETLKGEVDGVSQGTRAVDVVALHNEDSIGLLLLEAKDFRGHRIVNKPRIGDEIAAEVALKVRDTLAGLVGAARLLDPPSEYRAMKLPNALGLGKALMIVLWLEDDTLRDADHAKRQLGTLCEMLKKKLKWLNVKVFVLSSRVPNRLPELNVTNLSGAGQP